jgi:hypothetical protein
MPAGAHGASSNSGRNSFSTNRSESPISAGESGNVVRSVAHFGASLTSARADDHAGRSPITIAVAALMTIVNARTRASRVTSSKRSSSRGTSAAGYFTARSMRREQILRRCKFGLERPMCTADPALA